MPAYVWWFTQCKALVLYLKLVVWPWPLVIHHHIPYLRTIGAAWPWVVPIVAVGIGTLVLLWRNRPLGFLGAWVFVILSPTLVVPIVTEVAAERRMYLPLVAIVSLAIVGGFAGLHAALRSMTDASRALPLAITAAAVLMLATAYGLVSSRRLEAYGDVIGFWRDAVANQPDNPLPHVCLGIGLTVTGKSNEGIEHLNRALELKSEFNLIPIHQYLGVALINLNRNQEAIEHLQRALQLNPDSAEMLRLLAVALINTKRYQEAVDHLQKSLRIEPDYIAARIPLAIAYAGLGQSGDATAMAEKTIELARSRGDTKTATQMEKWLKNYRQKQAQP